MLTSSALRSSADAYRYVYHVLYTSSIVLQRTYLFEVLRYTHLPSAHPNLHTTSKPSPHPLCPTAAESEPGADTGTGGGPLRAAPLSVRPNSLRRAVYRRWYVSQVSSSMAHFPPSDSRGDTRTAAAHRHIRTPPPEDRWSSGVQYVQPEPH